MCAQLCPTLCDPDEPTRLLYSWDFPGKITGVASLFLLWGVFPIQVSNPHLLLWQVDPLKLSHQGNPNVILYCSSGAKSCLTLCNPMDYSMPGFPVLHYLPEFAQTHVHWVSDAIQPPHPLSPPSPLALSLSQHRGLFQWVILLLLLLLLSHFSRLRLCATP